MHIKRTMDKNRITEYQLKALGSAIVLRAIEDFDSAIKLLQSNITITIEGLEDIENNHPELWNSKMAIKLSVLKRRYYGALQYIQDLYIMTHSDKNLWMELIEIDKMKIWNQKTDSYKVKKIIIEHLGKEYIK